VIRKNISQRELILGGASLIFKKGFWTVRNKVSTVVAACAQKVGIQNPRVFWASGILLRQ
jgi:hypothetical protein